jgi:hypothetical protein
MAKTGFSEELTALGAVLGALEPLDEAKRLFVMRTVVDRLGLKETFTRGTPELGADQRRGARTHTEGVGQVEATTPKDFMRSKQPKTDVQRIACLADYLVRARETSQFKTLDLTKLNTEAAGAKFSNVAVAVSNATGAGLLTAAGGGKKQITALGEDVVKALPDQENVKLVLQNAKKPRKKRAKSSESSNTQRRQPSPHWALRFRLTVLLTGWVNSRPPVLLTPSACIFRAHFGLSMTFVINGTQHISPTGLTQICKMPHWWLTYSTGYSQSL